MGTIRKGRGIHEGSVPSAKYFNTVCSHFTTYFIPPLLKILIRLYQTANDLFLSTMIVRNNESTDIAGNFIISNALYIKSMNHIHKRSRMKRIDLPYD